MKLAQEGIFSINKPLGITSHDVVNRVRRLTGIRRVGHGGTLDPLAEGVLVVAVGRQFTKKLDEVVGAEKEYEAEIKFGMSSITDDEEGEKKEWKVDKIPTRKDIEKVLPIFIGKISQMPPIYSAIKVGGKKAYEEARKGRALRLEPRQVEIKKIDILDYNWPLLSIKVVCGKGVYIRSLAREIGEKLNVGGYITKLVRTRVGEYKLVNSIKIPPSEEPPPIRRAGVRSPRRSDFS
jgi:tRNA pseudouridine55 synthase